MNSSKLNEKISERQLALKAGLSRTSLRLLKKGQLNPTLKTLKKIAEASDHSLEILQYPKNSSADFRYSIPVVSYLTQLEGFGSWKIHFFNFINELVRTKDSRLFISPPIKKLDKKLQALLAVIVMELCHRNNWPPPLWADDISSLQHPWFLSESESLKASALLESPLRFKLKNIFILENFFDRV